jgi:hypothetical protein
MNDTQVLNSYYYVIETFFTSWSAENKFSTIFYWIKFWSVFFQIKANKICNCPCNYRNIRIIVTELQIMQQIRIIIYDLWNISYWIDLLIAESYLLFSLDWLNVINWSLAKAKWRDLWCFRNHLWTIFISRLYNFTFPGMLQIFSFSGIINGIR